MVGDFFNQYLVDDYDNLDRELNNSHWFQKQEEQMQQQMIDQYKPHGEEGLEQSLPMTEHHNNTPTSAPIESPFRNTFDRKKQTESKKDRLDRIRQEYNTPYISVSSLRSRKRRKRRRQQIKKLMLEQNSPEYLFGEEVKDGTAANMPGFTQLIEENEATITPLSSMGFSGKGFCKNAISFEDDPEAAEWFEQEKKKVEPVKDMDDLIKELDIEPDELEEWFKSAGGKRFCKNS